MNTTKQLICIIFLLLLSSCTQRPLSARDYVAWVNNKQHGLKVETTFGDFAFTLFYRPLPYLALKEFPDGQFKKQDINKQINDMSEFQYYTLEIASCDKKTDVLQNGLRSKDEYYARIQYFSFLMQNDLFLMDGDEKLPCKLFQYERDFNLSPFQRFSLGFPHSTSKKTNSDKSLVYVDKVLGIEKEVKLTIKGSNIEEIPDLNLN